MPEPPTFPPGTHTHEYTPTHSNPHILSLCPRVIIELRSRGSKFWIVVHNLFCLEAKKLLEFWLALRHRRFKSERQSALHIFDITAEQHAILNICFLHLSTIYSFEVRVLYWSINMQCYFYLLLLNVGTLVSSNIKVHAFHRVGLSCTGPVTEDTRSWCLYYCSTKQTSTDRWAAHLSLTHCFFFFFSKTYSSIQGWLLTCDYCLKFDRQLVLLSDCT